MASETGGVCGLPGQCRPQREVVKRDPRETCFVAQRETLACSKQCFAELAAFRVDASQVSKTRYECNPPRDRRFARKHNRLAIARERGVEVSGHPVRFGESAEHSDRQAFSARFLAKRSGFFEVQSRARQIAGQRFKC